MDAPEPVFAVKFINKNYALKYGRIKQKQLQMEITLHKHVGVHNNIIEFYESGEDSTWMWIAMELADGGDLFDKIEADSGVDVDTAHVYFTQLINAVGYMHSKGVGHRDIKPENILLSADGDLKLADFGMATLFEYGGKRKMAVTLCGSPPYVAPEVLSCGAVDGKAKGYSADLSDIWSCGVVLFVLLAGNTPWNRPVEGVDEYGRPNEFSEYVQTKGKPSDELWDALPTEVLSLLRGMMRVDSASRFLLADIRRHPWFTRKNKLMDANGRIVDQLSMATNMLEQLHVSFDADPMASTQRSRVADSTGKMSLGDDMGMLKPYKTAFSSTQPDTPAEDMLFDWEKPQHLTGPLTQPMAPGTAASQSAYHDRWLDDEPSMSQFALKPSVPMSRTQMARKFRDILPAQSLTKFYSTWSVALLVPLVVEALSRLGIPTPNVSVASTASECKIKVRAQDSRACTLNGNISVELVAESLVEVSFVKGTGDPLEWRRLFKKVAVLCKDAVYKPEADDDAMEM